MDAEHLADTLLRLARRLRHDTHEALAPLGLSPHQSRALRIIGELEPVRPGVVAARLHIVPRSVTDVLDDLAAAGWVRRSPDPDDRRASLVSLTPAGRQLWGRVNEVRREQAERMFGVLDEGSIDALGALLARVDAAPEGVERDGEAGGEGFAGDT